MDFVRCPECHSPVDLKSEIRYSPDRGANIYHAPCYISRQGRLIKRVVEAVVFVDGDRLYYHANGEEVGDDVARMIDQLEYGTR